MHQRHKILIIDDEESLCLLLERFLQEQGFATQRAASCKEAEERFCEETPDIVLMDYALPDGNALDLMTRLRQIDPHIPILLLTGHGSIELAVQAIKLGAEQFLVKPISMAVLYPLIERVLEAQRIRRKDMAHAGRNGRPLPNPFLGTSDAMRCLFAEANLVKGMDGPVLILGETGTGKGLLANWIHRHSSRAAEAFVDLNCAGLMHDFLETELFGHEKGAFTGAIVSKSGLLEMAHQGTVFLDEVGDLDLRIQPKLLKVLEEHRFRRLGALRDRTVDIRLIAATHQDLRAALLEKRFREDLYFRISTFTLRVPPLRERKQDIEPLAREIIRGMCTARGKMAPELSKSAIDVLENYRWPGNVRELKSVLERALLFCDQPVLDPSYLNLTDYGSSSAPAYHSRLTLDDLERLHIEYVLREEKGKVSSAAKRLGLSRSALYSKIQKPSSRPAQELEHEPEPAHVGRAQQIHS